jgi:hypothetical protein
VVQVPHEATVRLVPQLSAAVTLPQFFPSRVQNAASLSAVHPHTLPVPPPPHVWGNVHVPQSVVRDVPQLSAAVRLPQFFPSRVQNVALLSAVQPHTLVVPPPPQLWGAVHVPHEVTVRDVPQLSLAVTVPQFFPSRVQNAASASAVQPHTLAVPPPAHVCGEVHVPQSVVREAPQLSLAVTLPQFFPSRVQNAPLVSAVQPQTLGTDGVPPAHD